MSIYRYSAPSPVTSVLFRHANDRPPVAHIIAKQTISERQTSTIRRAVEAHGWQCVPACLDGKDGLQLSGFKDEGEVAAFLRVNHFAEGKPRITPEPGDHPGRNWQEWLQDSSMKACGWSYVIGDVALLISGLMSGRGKETTSGLLYTAGGLVLTRYGNVKTEHHVRRVSENLGDFLKIRRLPFPMIAAYSA